MGRLRKPMKDGLSEAHHLEALATRGNKEAQELLDGPEFPDALGYLWGWFRELDSARSTTSMEGPGSLTYEQILAWTQLTRRAPEPHEIEALFTLDTATRFPPKLNG